MYTALDNICQYSSSSSSNDPVSCSEPPVDTCVDSSGPDFSFPSISLFPISLVSSVGLLPSFHAIDLIVISSIFSRPSILRLFPLPMLCISLIKICVKHRVLSTEQSPRHQPLTLQNSLRVLLAEANSPRLSSD